MSAKQDESKALESLPSLDTLPEQEVPSDKCNNLLLGYQLKKLSSNVHRLLRYQVTVQ